MMWKKETILISTILILIRILLIEYYLFIQEDDSKDIYKISLRPGIYSEDAIIKNYLKNNNKKPLSNMGSKMSLPYIKCDVTDTKNDFSSKQQESSLSDMNNCKTYKLENNLFSDIKYFVKNFSLLVIDDNLLDGALKEYLNMNEFPVYLNDKISFIKKIILIYKKIRENDKIDIFLNKIGEKIKEKKEDMWRILELMFNKGKRERLIGTINKLNSKFVTCLVDKNLTDVTYLSKTLSDREVFEKLKAVQEKIDQFLKYTKEIK
jgi:hypothetical protein